MPNSEDFIAQAEGQLEYGSGRQRGGKAGRGGRGGGRGGQPRDVVVSKALSKLLRHDAVEAGLGLDAEGFAVVEDVVSFLFLSLFLFYSLLSLNLEGVCLLHRETSNMEVGKIDVSCVSRALHFP